MDAHTGKQRVFPAVAIAGVLFLLCIVPGQFWLAKLFPEISGLARIDPSFVFLDIPIDLPFTIDLVLAPALFLLIYPVVVAVYPSRPGIPAWQQATKRMRSAFVGLLVLLISVLAGGLMYYLVQEYFSRRVRNGINSLGINADIHLAYPGYENIHLRGSTIIMVCAMTGMWICIRKIKKEPGQQHAGQLTPEQRMTPYKRMIQEKRVKEKQLTQEGVIQKAGMKQQGQKADKTGQPETTTGQPAQKGQPVFCRTQPVMTFKPEAVNYMPMS